MTYYEYFKLVLISRLKKDGYDVDAVARHLNMKRGEVLRYMRLFSLETKVRGKKSA